MTSLRRFLVIVLLATITLFNFVAALHGYRSSIDKAQILFDKQLADISRFLMSYEIRQTSNVKMLPSEQSSIEYQIWLDEQRLIKRSSNTPQHPLVSLVAGYSYSNYQGYRWRTFVQQHPQSKYWFIVAERSDIRYALAEEVVLSSVFPIVAGLPLIGLLIWFIIGRGLSPLTQLATELRYKKAQDLSPLGTKGMPKELMPLIISTSDLMRRLSETFEREKRFSGDAAHELRTPLSALKVQLYNLGKSRAKEDSSLAMINMSIDRMAHIIEQMLTLYRSTPQQCIRHFKPLDFHQLVQQVVINLYPQLEAKNQSVELQGDSAQLNGDQFALETLVKNLLDNANKYTPVNGEIKILLKHDETQVHLWMHDTGCGIPKALHARVFERFYRVGGDQHRSNEIGCGLGFSIIKHIVELHGARIHLADSCFKQGLCVQVSLPKHQDN